MDRFGTDLALSGDTLAIGVPGDDSAASGSGAVYVFRRSDSSWVQEAYVKAEPAARAAAVYVFH